MIELATQLGPARIVERLSELPDIARLGVHTIFLDAETTSFDDKEPAVHPYLGHRACGWAITYDDAPGAWYVPIRHCDMQSNLPLQPVLQWLREILGAAYQWDNHNIKFDAHFASVDEVDFGDTRLGCTLTRAKMHDSDRWSHDLKELFRDWLGIDTSDEARVQAYLDGIPMPTQKSCQDYGRVPVDILGRYACMDVLGNRKLSRWLESQRPAEQKQLWENETLLTPVLFDMEKRGLRIDQRATKIEEFRCYRAMNECAELIDHELGIPLVDSNKCIHDIMTNQLGLPVLAYGDEKEDGTRGPTYDKDAMLLYSGHPRVISDDRTKRIVDAIQTYREESRFLGLFVKSFQEKLDNQGYIHPTYNQTVRTGRMSSRDPNSQQLNLRAKRLIIPDEGEAIFETDASQMEFRIIVHAIRDDDAIAAYKNDARTDFHQWVADLCGIPRKPAKNINFAMAYGAGKKKITAQLMGQEVVIEEASHEVDALIQAGKANASQRGELLTNLCEKKALEIYEEYHQAMPGIRNVAKASEALVKLRGYIRNPYKRRRHFAAKHAYKAFNTYIQGGAMDIIKERMIATSPRYQSWVRDMSWEMRANVHDALKFTGPATSIENPIHQRRVLETLCKVSVPFRVPFHWDSGTSRHNWADAKA